MRVAPLRALRATAEAAPVVASVPYDVVDRAEAQALALGNPRSYLHVTRPDVDFPEGTAATTLYASARRALDRLCADGSLLAETQPCYYVYGLSQHDHHQVGIVLHASIADYRAGAIRRHELTRPDKEAERVAHLTALGAQTGKVFLLHRPSPALSAVVDRSTQTPPVVDFVADDGVRHQLWRMEQADTIQAVTAAFAAMPRLYIADGHHRAAAASAAAGATGGAASGFLAVSFCTAEVRVWPYHRVVRDLADWTAESFLAALGAGFTVTPGLLPLGAGRLGLRLEQGWFTLAVKPELVASADPIGRLDVSLLQDHILGPLLGIVDPRRDPRLDFVGGTTGYGALDTRLAAGWAAAFAMHPTAIDALLQVADVEGLMPPKSTWFAPKLRDGLVTVAV